MCPVISNANSQRAGILDAVAETWQNKYPVFKEMQDMLFYNVPYTNIRNAEYVWKESLPMPRKWQYYAGRTRQVFKDRSIKCPVQGYELTIPFNLYDERDDQLQDVRTHVSKSVERFHMISDQLVAEYLNGALTFNLNNELRTAYDGGGIFDAFEGDGATDRLGVTGGNLLTGNGLTTAGVITDVARAQQRFLNMRDTAGQPIYTEADVDYGNLCIIGPNEANEVLQRATGSEYLRTDATNVVSESNYQKGTWQYKLNTYLTSANDLYVCVKNSYWKPFLHRSPDAEGIRSIYADFDNSDRARDTNEAELLSDVRIGLTPWFVGAMVKINNT